MIGKWKGTLFQQSRTGAFEVQFPTATAFGERAPSHEAVCRPTGQSGRQEERRVKGHGREDCPVNRIQAAQQHRRPTWSLGCKTRGPRHSGGTPGRGLVKAGPMSSADQGAPTGAFAPAPSPPLSPGIKLTCDQALRGTKHIQSPGPAWERKLWA